MTNQELDHWLAEKVMGWVSKDFQWIANDGHRPRLGIVNPDPDPYESGCAECDWWHPTTNIAQAIEAVEKAMTIDSPGKILNWSSGSRDSYVERKLRPGENGILLPYRLFIGIGTPSEPLCRALYEALTRDP